MVEKRNHNKFSVIVPVFNVEKFLHRCIQSILAQELNNFELILVDDGSTDTSGLICDKYSEHNNVIVVHKPNGGLVSARKTGVKIATGDYIISIDSDDYIEEGYFIKICDIVDKYSPDVIMFNLKICGNSDTYTDRYNKKNKYYDKNMLSNEIFPTMIHDIDGSYLPPNLVTKVIRRSIYTKNQLAVNDKITISEDCACSYPCLMRAESVYMCNEAYYCYVQNFDSMTRNKTPFPVIGPKLLFDRLLEVQEKCDFDFSSQIYRKICHEIFIMLLTQFYRQKKFKDLCLFLGEVCNKYDYFIIAKLSYFKPFTRASFMRISIICKFWLLLKWYSSKWRR